MITIIVILAVATNLLFIATRRGLRVRSERRRVLKVISVLVQEDYRLGLDYLWREREFDAVSSNRMLCEFWRPVKSYFRGARCCRSADDRGIE